MWLRLTKLWCQKNRGAAARADEECDSPSARRDLHQFFHREEFCRTARARRFTSRRLAEDVQFASIGPVTSATLRELQMPVAIEAREFTMGGLIRAIVLARYAENA